MHRLLCSANEESYLMRAGDRTVLILCSFFARTRLTVAVVPEGRIRQTLEICGALADILTALHLRLSPATLLCNISTDESTNEETVRKMMEEAARILIPWLNRIQAPLFFDRRDCGNFDTTVAAIAYRTTHLALLCGCRFSYDFTGFGYGQMKVDDFNLLVGSAFAVFLTAYRTARERTVVMEGTRTYGIGPVIHALLDCGPSPGPFPELEPLCRLTGLRGELFDICPYPANPHWLDIGFSIQVGEISKQDIKNGLPYPEQKHVLSSPYPQAENAEEPGNISDT